MGWGGECVCPDCYLRVRFQYSTQTCGFKSSEADIWLSRSPDGCRRKRGGCQQLLQRNGACLLLNKKEALSGLIQVNFDEERKGGQAGRVCGCQL